MECILCYGGNYRSLYPGILKCVDCGHVFADVDVTDQDMVKIYSERYFFGEEYSNYIREKSALQKNFRRRIDILKSIDADLSNKSILEIGCAYGFFLELAQKYFGSAVGFDIAQDAILYARNTLGLEAYCDNFLDHDFCGRKFDVVCMWDTIEHLLYPDQYVSKISEIVPSGGLFALTTGDIESSVARLQKENWRMIHPPTHIHYFSKRTIGLLLRKYGFEPVYNRYHGIYRSLGNIFYNIFVLRRNFRPIYDFVDAIGLSRFDLCVNLYDIMLVVARKK